MTTGGGEQRFSKSEAPDPRGGVRVGQGRRGQKNAEEVKREEGTSISWRSVMFQLD